MVLFDNWRMSLPVGLDEKDSLTESNCFGCLPRHKGLIPERILRTCTHNEIDKVCSIGDHVTVDQLIK